MAQKELHKVLKRSKTQLKNIESHIKEGTTVLERKQKSLLELDPKSESATVDKKAESTDFEMDLSQKSAVKKEKDSTSKKEAKSSEATKAAKKDESDKKDDVKKESNTFDLESLTEKNNKMWDVKFKEAK